jgi:hypothetical protein
MSLQGMKVKVLPTSIIVRKAAATIRVAAAFRVTSTVCSVHRATTMLQQRQDRLRRSTTMIASNVLL